MLLEVCWQLDCMIAPRNNPLQGQWWNTGQLLEGEALVLRLRWLRHTGLVREKSEVVCVDFSHSVG